VSDLLKGLAGGNAAVLYAWIFPSALVLGAFWLFIFPELQDLRFAWRFADLSSTEQSGVFVGISAGLGVFLNAVSTPLYRVLEGYLLWPACLRKRGVARQRAIKASLQPGQGATGWLAELKLEKWSRFPDEDDEIAPTRLGNALRAFETYGSSRFELDSQTMWSELCAVIPKYLQDELDQSRASVDFFVALVYLSIAFGVVSFVLGVIERRNGWILVWAVAALLSSYLWYRLAVVASSYWAATVQALVNIGRSKLATEMGLCLPDSIDAEREMWGLVTRFVFYGSVNEARQLDPYRCKCKCNPDKEAADGAEPKPAVEVISVALTETSDAPEL